VKKIRVAVLASGRGSNFRAISEAAKKGEISADMVVLISDNPAAAAISYAKENKIPVELVDFGKFQNKEDADLEIKKTLDRYKADLVVLAGYMRIVRSKVLLDAYKYRIINIHPSLLPAFTGSTHAQKDAFEYGCKVSGLTIHFVTADVDGGAVIFQKAIDISDCKSADETAAKILKVEHESYKKVVDSFAKGKYRVEGRRVIYEKSD
jgi:phosphoribosylglycinamide formyltransferase-1